MPRRRYISTDISVDKRINALSDFAALLYTWMVPHADDDGTITADPDEIGWTVVPGRRRRTPQIAAALEEIENQTLVISNGCGKLFFPFESFYKYQTYIPPAKRRDFDPNAEKRRKTPKNAASPSPSPSPSKTYVQREASDHSEFGSFWSSYPRKEGKGKAREAFKLAARKVDASVILAGLEAQLPSMKAKERQYQPMPTTWLNQERWDDEVEAKNTPKTAAHETFQLPDPAEPDEKQRQEALEALKKINEKIGRKM